MNKRTLGKTSLELSVIGFGAWAIGGDRWRFGWGPQDDRESVDAIIRALDLGINWIDTAPVYGLGHSEELVGKAVQGRRDKVVIATKCSLVWDASGRISSSLARESIRRECEASLRRLRTDVIDLYQIHWPNDDARIEEGWAELGRLIDDGKIRHAGVSNFDVSQMDRAQALRPIASLQPPYSMLRRQIEAEVLPYCASRRIGVLAYSPLQSGLLSGTFDPRRLTPTDWRSRDAEFKEPALSATLQLVEGLRALAGDHHRSVAELAIAWVLRRPEITSAIVGARRPDQIAQTAGAADWTLTEAEIDTVERLLEARRRQIPDSDTRFRE